MYPEIYVIYIFGEIFVVVDYGLLQDVYGLCPFCGEIHKLASW